MTADWLAVRARIVSGVLVVLVALAPLAARGAGHCSRITDPAARLACYDAMYPVASPAAAHPTPAQSSAPGHSASSPTFAVPATATDAAAPQHIAPAPAAGSTPSAVLPPPPAVVLEGTPAAPPPAGQGAADRFGLPPQNPLAAAEEVDQLESTVVSVRRQAKQNTAYRLANGQVWMQTVPREVTIDEGDHVTIRRGMLGGYVLRNRDGASTRVGRIR